MSTTASKPSRKQIPLSQQKLIWAYSAGQCASPECPLRTLERETESNDATVVGEVAHIHAYEDDGPRADLSLSLETRNKYPNLLLLCGHHHIVVDKQPLTYTADMLRQWKRDTEKRVSDALRNAMPQVSFSQS